MTEEQEPLMEPAPRLTFARKNDLQKILKALDKVTPEALNTLVEIMQDPKSEAKLKADVAKAILDKRVSVSESIARDQLSRSVAESRLILAEMQQKRNLLPKPVNGDDEEDGPEENLGAVFMPEIIQAVNKPHDFSNIKEM